MAAGQGNRITGNLPKQFMTLEGREILAYSVNTFRLHAGIQGVVIVTAKPFMKQVKKNFPQCQVIEGGDTRQASSARGVAACPGNAEKILIHDAARPFVSPEIITTCLLALDSYDAAAPVIPAKDTLVLATAAGWERLNRNRIKAMQTPQGFRAPVIRAAQATGVAGTDEIGLVLAALPEAAVQLFAGDPENFKITTPLDLELAACMAARFHRS